MSPKQDPPRFPLLPEGWLLLLLADSLGKTYQTMPSLLNPGTNPFPVSISEPFWANLSRRHCLTPFWLGHRPGEPGLLFDLSGSCCQNNQLLVVTKPRILPSEPSKSKKKRTIFADLGLRSRKDFFLISVMFRHPALKTRRPGHPPWTCSPARENFLRHIEVLTLCPWNSPCPCQMPLPSSPLLICLILQQLLPWFLGYLQNKK